MAAVAWLVHARARSGRDVDVAGWSTLCRAFFLRVLVYAAGAAHHAAEVGVLVVAVEHEAVEPAGARLPVEVERDRLSWTGLVQWDLEPARLANVTGARQSGRVGVVRERGIKLDMAVAAEQAAVLRVELDLLVLKADGIGREDIEVPLVARMALAIPGSGFGSGLGQGQGQG